MIHPATRVAEVSPSVGLGVFATASIPAGTIVWTQDRFDRVISPAEYAEMDAAHRAVLDRYAHLDADQTRILCWDAGRYVNHACRPNLRGIGTWFMVASRDIGSGDELTCDYAECNILEPLDCRCGSPRCRGRVHAEDLRFHYAAMDDEARALLPAVRSVRQPLWPFLLDPDRARAWIQGEEDLPSFRDFCASPAA